MWKRGPTERREMGEGNCKKGGKGGRILIVKRRKERRGRESCRIVRRSEEGREDKARRMMQIRRGVVEENGRKQVEMREGEERRMLGVGEMESMRQGMLQG